MMTHRIYSPLALVSFLAASLLSTALPAFAQAPIPAPTPTPTVQIPPALPPIVKYEHFISAGYILPPLVCNEFSACFPGKRYRSGVLRGTVEFPIGGINLTGMVKVDARRYVYPHYGTAGPALACAPGSTNPSCVRMIGPNGAVSFPVGAFTVRDTEYDLRAGVRALEPRLYLAVSYLQRANNYGYPRLKGYGIGLEKLPDVDQIFSLYGGAYYYPMVRSNFANSAGTMFDLAYHVLRYDLGVTLKPSTHSPFFIDAGYLGDHSRNANNAPSNIKRNGPFAGLGLSF